MERLAVGVPLGLLPWNGELAEAHGGAAIRFLTPPPGIVQSVSAPNGAGTAVPGAELTLRAAIGDTIPPLTWSVDRVAGHVLATGGTAVEAFDRCCRLGGSGLHPDRRGLTAGSAFQ